MQNNPTQNKLAKNCSELTSDSNDMITAGALHVIRRLSNHDLDLILGRELKRESQQTMVVIHHMREVDRRRLWAELGYASLSKYCADRFQMSDSDFYRKLSIMRTLTDMPEIEAKIISGDLNPTVVAMAHTYFRKNTKLKGRKVTKEEKTLVFEQITGQSQREVERTFATLSPELPPTDQKKFISNDRIMNTYATKTSVEEKFDRLKEILLASLPNDPDRNDVLDKIFDIALAQVDPMKKIERAEKRKTGKLNRLRRMESRKNRTVVCNLESFNVEEIKGAEKVDAPKKLNGPKNLDGAEELDGTGNFDGLEKFNEPEKIDGTEEVDRPEKLEAAAAEVTKSPSLRKRCVTYRPYRSVHKMRVLYGRSEGICEFVCVETGRRCTARGALQTDHIQGFARGGSEEVENFRLYCHAHNQFAAIQTYGPKRIEKFVPAIR